MFAIAGGHWAVLQSVAWGQMLVIYSKQEGSFLAGAEKTFSGEAPCSMCRKIAEAKKQEEKAPATIKADKKSDTTIVVFGSILPPAAQPDQVFRSFEDKFLIRSEAPPTPIPIVRA